MILTFSPVRMDDPLVIARAGDVLTVNGVAFDFSGIPEGGSLQAEEFDCPFLTGDVTRTGGTLHLTLLLPHGANAPPETRFPEPLTLTGDGAVDLPPRGDEVG